MDEDTKMNESIKEIAEKQMEEHHHGILKAVRKSGYDCRIYANELLSLALDAISMAYHTFNDTREDEEGYIKQVMNATEKAFREYMTDNREPKTANAKKVVFVIKNTIANA